MTTETTLLDTNVLIRALVADDPEHPQVRVALLQCLLNGVPMVICSQNLFELWAVLTRPVDANGYGLSTAEVAQKVHQILESFPLLTEPSSLVRTWVDLCLQYDVKGKQVHDARLVALMKAVGIRQLLTLDKEGFERFQAEIICLHPSEIVAR